MTVQGEDPSLCSLGLPERAVRPLSLDLSA
jgi:hypothetical protein